MMATRTIDDLCYLVYENLGQGAVEAMLAAVGWSQYLVCDPCDGEMPMSEGACLICGTVA
jgi:hypothetical protein